MFTMKFSTANDAFTANASEYEIARILRAVANRIEYGAAEGRIQDSNGNTVGNFKLTNG